MHVEVAAPMCWGMTLYDTQGAHSQAELSRSMMLIRGARENEAPQHSPEDVPGVKYRHAGGGGGGDAHVLGHDAVQRSGAVGAGGGGGGFFKCRSCTA